MASASENIIQLDNSKCRICLFSNQNLCPLFKRGLSMKVMKLAEIKMYEGDGLPSSICLDCEFEVKRCIKFIARIQMADAKLKEMLAKKKELSAAYEKEKESVERLAEREEQEGEASTYQGDTENNDQPEDTNELNPLDNIQHNDQPENTNEPNPLIEIEEFNVKQEITSLDNFISEKEEVHSESDHDHFGEDIENNEQQQDENILNPINHVDIVEDRNRGDGMDVSNDPLGQEEPLIETQKNENDPSVDPLTCMKQEVVPMDIDKDTTPTASGSSSSVATSVVSMPCKPPQLSNQTMDLLKNQVVQESGLNRVSIEQNPLTRNTIWEWSITGTDLHTLDNLMCSIPYPSSANSWLKKNCAKPKNTKLRKIKNTLVSNKTCSEKTSPKSLETMSENTFFCVVCNIDFSSSESLKDHKVKKGFICRVCTTEFVNHHDLEIHFLNHAINCQICKEVFYTMKELIVHRSKMHTVNQFECQTCSKTCSTQYGLYKHVKLSHGGNEDSSKCVVCEKTFKCSFQLKQHLVLSHVAYEHLECKFCHMFYLGPNKLQSHIKKIHLDSEENKPISCLTCGKVFNRASLLMKHQETHDNTVSVCEICGKSIKTKSLMISHMEMQHSRTGTFTCKICNEQFGVKKTLRMHQRKHHQKRSKPVFCEICGKEYKSKQILKSHKLTHIDERPFKCDLCGATFKQTVTLKTHQRVHSSIGKYCCTGCGTSFKWKQTYDKHLNKCEGTLCSS